MPKSLRLLLSLASLLLVAAIFWYLSRPFFTGEYDLGVLLAQIKWQTLLLMFLLYTLALVLAVGVWGSMMGEVAPPLPWREHWYIYTTTSVTRRLPGSFWHVAGRVMLYQQHGIARRAVAVISGLEVVLMMFSGACIVLLSWPALRAQMTEGWQLGLLVGGIGAGGLILVHPSNWQRLRSAAGEMASHDRAFRPATLLLWLGGYGLIWSLGGVVIALLAASLAPLPVTALPGVVGAWVLAGLTGLLIMVLPSGLGVTELSLTAMLLPYMPAPLAALVAIGSRLLMTLFELLFALLTWLIHPVLRRLTQKE